LSARQLLDSLKKAVSRERSNDEVNQTENTTVLDKAARMIAKDTLLKRVPANRSGCNFNIINHRFTGDLDLLLGRTSKLSVNTPTKIKNQND
jgi:hypothetical protein